MCARQRRTAAPRDQRGVTSLVDHFGKAIDKIRIVLDNENTRRGNRSIHPTHLDLFVPELRRGLAGPAATSTAPLPWIQHAARSSGSQWQFAAPTTAVANLVGIRQLPSVIRHAYRTRRGVGYWMNESWTLPKGDPMPTFPITLSDEEAQQLEASAQNRETTPDALIQRWVRER